MPEFERKHVGALLLGVAGLGALLVLAREATHDGPLGETRNPNFGHATKASAGHGQPAHRPGEMTEEQYYEGLKANRPDLSESELRAKADHWWKVRNGQAAVSGG